MTTPKTPIPGRPDIEFEPPDAPREPAESSEHAPVPQGPASRIPRPASRIALPGTRVPLPATVALVFLLFTIAGFIALGAALPSYTLSSTARRGLTYDTLFAELHDALVDEPDRPLRRAIQVVQVDALVPTPNGYMMVTFDSLAVSPDATFPSLLPAGFLRDQIDRFNGYQRERVDAVRRGRLSGGSMLDMRAAENPSIFRTEMRSGAENAAPERDSVALAERAVPYPLRVPSPFDAARLVAVTTREFSRNLSWISPRGTQPLGESGRVPGEPPCPFRSRRDSVYIECTAPGSPFSQLVLRFPDRMGETGTATLFTSERTLYDGAQLPRRRTTPIGTGGMFQFHSAALASRRVRPEPVILEWQLGGTLGGTQWINGRIRWQPSVMHTSPFVKQLASAAGFGASVELEGGRNIPLSLDEALTDELQGALEEFSNCGLQASRCGPSAERRVRSVRSPQSAVRAASDISFATIVLASAKSGEVLAVAEYGAPAAGGGSWILKPVNVGSAIKPVLAASALLERPELATLEIHNDGPMMSDVWGVALDKPFEAGSSCPIGWIGLRLFLSCSSNRYAAALVAAALQPNAQPGALRWDDVPPGVTFRLAGQTHSGRRPHLPLDRSRRVRADTLNASALAAGLFAFDSLNTSLELAAQLGREGRDSSAWKGLRDDRLHPVRVPIGLWPEQSRLALARGNRAVTLRQLAMFAVGAAENRVTTLDLTEAFGRILTDRHLSLTFVPAAEQASFPALGLSKNSWYGAFIGGLHDVGTVGTAKGTQDAVARQLSPSLLFYGKSGTLNAAPHIRTIRRWDSTVVKGVLVARPMAFVDTVVPPVVAKTLVFGLGVRRGDGGVGAGAGGEAGGRRQDEGATGGAGSGGVISCGVVGTIYFRLRRNPPHVESLATEFANERLWRVLRKHWQRLKLC